MVELEKNTLSMVNVFSTTADTWVFTRVLRLRDFGRKMRGRRPYRTVLEYADHL